MNNGNNEEKVLLEDFISGLLKIVKGMNEQLRTMLEKENLTTQELAKARQLDTDIEVLLKYVDDFYDKNDLQ